MQKYISYILILFAIISFVAPVHFSLADIVCQPPKVMGSDGNSCVDPYNLLAPLPCTGGPETGCVGGQLITFDPTGAGGGALGGYLNLMIKLFIGICAVLAVIMIVMGGIQYMTSELISSKEAGKERIRNAIFGLLLALGAYTLLFTINPNLLNTDLKSLESVTVEVDLNADVPQTTVNGRYRNGVAVGTTLTGTSTPLPSGVSLNASQCATVGQQNCTSTIGLNMSQVQAIQQGCGCPLVITGGTEWWLHGGQTGSTSHQNNSSTVDLRISPALNAYLSGGRALVRMQRYQSPVGSVLYEGNHWHIGS